MCGQDIHSFCVTGNCPGDLRLGTSSALQDLEPGRIADLDNFLDLFRALIFI